MSSCIFISIFKQCHTKKTQSKGNSSFGMTTTKVLRQGFNVISLRWIMPGVIKHSLTSSQIFSPLVLKHSGLLGVTLCPSGTGPKHRFTYPKGVHSYRYFLPSNSYSPNYDFCRKRQCSKQWQVGSHQHQVAFFLGKFLFCVCFDPFWPILRGFEIFLQCPGRLWGILCLFFFSLHSALWGSQME